jgi:hypothetical protein
LADTAYSPGLDRLNALTQYSQQALLFQRMMQGVATAKLVQVLSCTVAGADGPIGRVNVTPLVNQIDGFGNATPHGTIYSIPYFRYQGGVDAIILDPVAGDIGIIIVMDKDTSSAVRTGQQANPGSRRTFNLSDGMYIGAFLSSAAPQQFLQFLPGVGITMKDISGSEVIMAGGGITLAPKNGVVTVDGMITATGLGGVGMTVTGSMNATGAITAGNGTADAVNLQLHVHSGVATGGANTAVPVPGT